MFVDERAIRLVKVLLPRLGLRKRWKQGTRRQDERQDQGWKHHPPHQQRQQYHRANRMGVRAERGGGRPRGQGTPSRTDRVGCFLRSMQQCQTLAYRPRKLVHWSNRRRRKDCAHRSEPAGLGRFDRATHVTGSVAPSPWRGRTEPWAPNLHLLALPCRPPATSPSGPAHQTVGAAPACTNQTCTGGFRRLAIAFVTHERDFCVLRPTAQCFVAAKTVAAFLQQQSQQHHCPRCSSEKQQTLWKDAVRVEKTKMVSQLDAEHHLVGLPRQLGFLWHLNLRPAVKRSELWKSVPHAGASDENHQESQRDALGDIFELTQKLKHSQEHTDLSPCACSLQFLACGNCLVFGESSIAFMCTPMDETSSRSGHQVCVWQVETRLCRFTVPAAFGIVGVLLCITYPSSGVSVVDWCADHVQQLTPSLETWAIIQSTRSDTSHSMSVHDVGQLKKIASLQRRHRQHLADRWCGVVSTVTIGIPADMTSPQILTHRICREVRGNAQWYAQ